MIGPEVSLGWSVGELGEWIANCIGLGGTVPQVMGKSRGILCCSSFASGDGDFSTSASSGFMLMV